LPSNCTHHFEEIAMSQSGQQHPKADNGGQRPADPKKSDSNSSTRQGATKQAIEAGKGGSAGATKDAKK
jgi:hypothetical protein